MAVVISGRTYGLGALLALIVLLVSIVLLVVGHITPFALLILIGLLALAVLV